jgi:nicotinamidase-related amidase
MNRALLVIDVQESFRTRPADWSEMHNPDIAKQVTRLVDSSRERGDLVVWVMHAEPGSDTVFDPDQGFVRLFDELEPQANEPRVVKTSINAFTTTNLQQQLVQNGIREVVICGIRTEQCCETTARVASDLGFDVTFVADATTTSGIDGLSAADIIERTARVLEAREFATIVTTDELVAS